MAAGLILLGAAPCAAIIFVWAKPGNATAISAFKAKASPFTAIALAETVVILFALQAETIIIQSHSIFIVARAAAREAKRWQFARLTLLDCSRFPPVIPMRSEDAMVTFPKFIHLALTLALGLATSNAASAYSGEVYVTCGLNPQGDNFLALRRCGSTSCAMTHKLGPGTYMLSFEPQGTNGWREVSILNSPDEMDLAGPTGWVYERYICRFRQ